MERKQAIVSPILSQEYSRGGEPRDKVYYALKTRVALRAKRWGDQ